MIVEKQSLILVYVIGIIKISGKICHKTQLYRLILGKKNSAGLQKSYTSSFFAALP